MVFVKIIKLNREFFYLFIYTYDRGTVDGMRVGQEKCHLYCTYTRIWGTTYTINNVAYAYLRGVTGAVGLPGLGHGR